MPKATNFFKTINKPYKYDVEYFVLDLYGIAKTTVIEASAAGQ